MRPVSTKTLSAESRFSRSFWNKLRVTGGGPPYYKVGRKVVYDLEEAMAWISARRQQSTSQNYSINKK